MEALYSIIYEERIGRPISFKKIGEFIEDCLN